MASENPTKSSSIPPPVPVKPQKPQIPIKPTEVKTPQVMTQINDYIKPTITPVTTPKVMTPSDDNIKPTIVTTPKTKIIASSDDSKYLNILLLGQTGVGKTCWINALDNYLKYSSLEEAEKNPQFLIPFQFTMMDEEYNEILIKCPGRTTETVTSSTSETHHSTVHTINYGSKIIRLIDTPGFAQPGGIAQDIKNFDNIMSQLKSGDKSMEKIDAILIFLKPNEARLDYKFQFCLKYLFTYLPCGAYKNLIFAFSNTRGNSFRPGETLTTLKTFFSQIVGPSNVPITLDKQTMYCYDSEAVRYLGTKQWSKKNTLEAKKLEISPDQFSSSNLSWQNSTGEAKRLLEYISSSSIEPISAKTIVVINEIQNILHLLRGPLIDLSLIIQGNIQNAENCLLSNSNSKNDKLFPVKLETIQFDRLRNSRTVCISSDCSSKQTGKNAPNVSNRSIYPNVCHDNCQIVNFGILGTPNSCDCFEGGSDKRNCKECECDYSKHISVNFDMILFERNKQVEDLQGLVEQFNRENNDILRIGKIVRNFLTKNAMVLYSDPIVEYLEQRIQIEKDSLDKAQSDGPEKSKLIKFENILKQYRNGKDENQDDTSIESVQDILRLIEQLGQSPLMGSSLKSLVIQTRKLTKEAERPRQEFKVQKKLQQASPPSQQQFEPKVNPFDRSHPNHDNNHSNQGENRDRLSPPNAEITGRRKSKLRGLKSWGHSPNHVQRNHSDHPESLERPRRNRSDCVML